MDDGKEKTQVKTIAVEAIKSVATGASMVIPGVSGGTMALVFGFYDKLIYSVSHLFSEFKRSFLTLLFYMLSVVVGFFLFSGVMSWLTEVAKLPVYSFFIGAILGGVPVVIGKAGIKKPRFTDIIAPVIGAAAVFGLSSIPEGIFAANALTGFPKYLMLFGAGLLLAVALVMPGISFSHMLIVLGIFEEFLAAVKGLDILYLLPIGISSVIGVLLIAKLLNYCMTKIPRQTFLAVLGFAVASAIDISLQYIIPELRLDLASFSCILTLVAGFTAIYFISKLKKET